MDDATQDNRTFGIVLIFSLTAAFIVFVGIVKFLIFSQVEHEIRDTAFVMEVANKLTDNPKPDQMESAWEIREIQLSEAGCSFKVNIKGMWIPIHATKEHPRYKDYVDNLHHYPDYLTFAKTDNPKTQSLGDLIYPTGCSIGNKNGWVVAANYPIHLSPTL